MTINWVEYNNIETLKNFFLQIMHLNKLEIKNMAKNSLS